MVVECHAVDGHELGFQDLHSSPQLLLHCSGMDIGELSASTARQIPGLSENACHEATEEAQRVQGDPRGDEKERVKEKLAVSDVI